jgi:hypothetical protein
MAEIRIPVTVTGQHPSGRVVFDAILRVPLAEIEAKAIGAAAAAVLGIDWATAHVEVRAGR